VEVAPPPTKAGWGRFRQANRARGARKASLAGPAIAAAGLEATAAGQA
jgi:hypothetical protein